MLSKSISILVKISWCSVALSLKRCVSNPPGVQPCIGRTIIRSEDEGSLQGWTPQMSSDSPLFWSTTHVSTASCVDTYSPIEIFHHGGFPPETPADPP